MLHNFDWRQKAANVSFLTLEMYWEQFVALLNPMHAIDMEISAKEYVCSFSLAFQIVFSLSLLHACPHALFKVTYHHTEHVQYVCRHMKFVVRQQ